MDYDAFWGCPNYPECKGTMKHSIFLAEQEQRNTFGHVTSDEIPRGDSDDIQF